MNSHHMLRSLFSAALLTMAAAPSVRAEGTFDIPPGAHFNPQKLERVGDYLRDQAATGKIPGAILLIQQHGKPVYHEFFGVRDVATKLPMTDDTIFRLFSMSKPITSVVAMQLIEEGKFSLDDPIAKYIPSFTNVKVGVEKKALMGEMFSDADLAQQERLKCAFDGQGLLNPGKVFPTLHACVEMGRMHVHDGRMPFGNLPRM